VPDLSDIPPNAVESERAVIGSMLIERRACDRARLYLGVGDFYSELHQTIYKAVDAIINRDPHAVIDTVLVHQELKENGNLGEAGGMKYLVECTKFVSTTAHVEHYARLVKKTSLQRQITVQLHKTHSQKTPENVEKLGRLISAAESLGAGRIFDMREDLADAITEILEKREMGVKTGFDDLDDALLGFERGDLITIGARTSGGKTALMTRMAVNMASRGDEVLYITTEMKTPSMIERILPMATNIPLWRFRKRDYSNGQMEAVTKTSAEYLSGLSLRIYDNPRPNLSDIRAAIVRSGARIVFIDYLQRCRYPKADNRTYQIQELMVGLKTFAQNSNVTIVIACQLDRQRDRSPKNAPVLAELKDSGAIEAESDVVLLMWTPPKELWKGPVIGDGCIPIEMLIKKCRNGDASTACHLELKKELIKIASAGKSFEPVSENAVLAANVIESGEDWYKDD